MDEAAMRERIAMIEQDERSVHRRLDNLENLIESVHIIATETKALRENMNSLTDRVTEIEQKPTKRLDGIVNIILTAIISGAIGYAARLFI